MSKDKTIIITVSGGLIQDIENIPPGVVIEVRDFDTYDYGPEDIDEADDYREFEGKIAQVSLWTGPKT